MSRKSIEVKEREAALKAKECERRKKEKERKAQIKQEKRDRRYEKRAVKQSKKDNARANKDALRDYVSNLDVSDKVNRYIYNHSLNDTPDRIHRLTKKYRNREYWRIRRKYSHYFKS